MKLFTDIHGAHRMNPTYFGYPLTFPLAPPVTVFMKVFSYPVKISQLFYQST